MRRTCWLLLPLLFIACGGDAPSTPERTLRVALEDTPRTLDPRFATDAHGQRISRHLLYNSLVQHGYELEYVPDLAERWETPDPQTYVFHLRRDAVFHDGHPFSADDVVFTYEHLMDEATGAPIGAALREKITGVEKIDDHTVRMRLTRPSAGFLTSIITAMVPKHLVEAGVDLGEQPVGTGPFRLLSRSPNRLVLVPHADYHEGAPQLDQLVFEVVRDAGTRFLKLRKEELDVVINGLPEHQVDDVRKPPLSEEYTLVETPGVNYNYLAFNLEDPILHIREVRRAIALALDLDALIEHRLHGHATRSRALLPPVSPFLDRDLPLVERDLNQAQTLLDAAGFTDPDGDGPAPRLTLELKTSNKATAVGNARVLQAQLAEVGIRVELRSYEWGTFYGDIQSGNFQLTMMRWVGVSEPDFYYEIFHSSQVPPNGRNRGHYDNPEMDRLLEAGRFTVDPDEQKRIYAEIQRLAAEDLPYVSLWHLNNVAVVHRRVKGYRQNPKAGYFSFREITVE